MIFATTQIDALCPPDHMVDGHDMSDAGVLFGRCTDTKQFRFVPPSERCVVGSDAMPLWLLCIEKNSTFFQKRDAELWSQKFGGN